MPGIVLDGIVTPFQVVELGPSRNQALLSGKVIII